MALLLVAAPGLSGVPADASGSSVEEDGVPRSIARVESWSSAGTYAKTIDVPAPADIEVGDLLIGFHTHRETPSVPAGFTRLAGVQVTRSDDSSPHHVSTWWKFATPDDVLLASYRWGDGVSSSFRHAVGMLRISGADPDAPFGPRARDVHNRVGDDLVAPSVVIDEPALVLRLWRTHMGEITLDGAQLPTFDVRQENDIIGWGRVAASFEVAPSTGPVPASSASHTGSNGGFFGATVVVNGAPDVHPAPDPDPAPAPDPDPDQPDLEADPRVGPIFRDDFERATLGPAWSTGSMWDISYDRAKTRKRSTVWWSGALTEEQRSAGFYVEAMVAKSGPTSVGLVVGDGDDFVFAHLFRDSEARLGMDGASGYTRIAHTPLIQEYNEFYTVRLEVLDRVGAMYVDGVLVNTGLVVLAGSSVGLRAVSSGSNNYLAEYFEVGQLAPPSGGEAPEPVPDPDPVPGPDPEGLELTVVDNTVHLSWPQVDEAIGYEVERAQDHLVNPAFDPPSHEGRAVPWEQPDTQKPNVLASHVSRDLDWAQRLEIVNAEDMLKNVSLQQRELAIPGRSLFRLRMTGTTSGEYVRTYASAGSSGTTWERLEKVTASDGSFDVQWDVDRRTSKDSTTWRLSFTGHRTSASRWRNGDHLELHEVLGATVTYHATTSPRFTDEQAIPGRRVLYRVRPLFEGADPGPWSDEVAAILD
jgi:hypothetical protein